MSAHEEDGYQPCTACGVTFDVHAVLSPQCSGDASAKGRWIEFHLSADQPPKTKRWIVYARGGGQLGVVQWHGAWRRYAFFPGTGTLFEPTCLRDLATFCDEQMAIRKATR